jgi:hypothetical protein
MVVLPDEATEAEIEEQLASGRLNVGPGRAAPLPVEQSKKETWPSCSTSGPPRRNVPRSSGFTPGSPKQV